MRIIELSDNAAMRGRQATAHAQAPAAGSERCRQQGRPWPGWVRRRFCAALRSWITGTQQTPAAVHRRVSVQERRLAAGVRGERRLAAALSHALDERWVLLRGYRNRCGEIDQLLLGPAGLFAIGVKHRNATIHCDGDEWRFQKHDRNGNPVEHRPLTDGHRRSPSRQLNEPTDLLEAFLARRQQPLSITRILLFAHPAARLGSIESPTVHVTTDPNRIVGLIGDSPPVIPGRRLGQIERLIIRDHDFNQRERDVARDRRARPVTSSYGG